VAQHIGSLPPVSSLFAAVLGVNPVQHLLAASHALSSLPAASQKVLTGREFFPQLISEPFHHGLTIVLIMSTALSVLAGLASLLRGGRYVPTAASAASAGPPSPVASAVSSTAADETVPLPADGEGPASNGRAHAPARTPGREERDGPDQRR
jgi:hypothetical protein